MSRSPRVTTYNVTARRKVSVPRLKIAALADLHACKPYTPPEQIAALVAQTNALGADLIVLLGDYEGHVIGGSPSHPREIVPILDGLSAPLGVFAVMGNHDWWVNGRVGRPGQIGSPWHGAFQASNIRMLLNDVVDLGGMQIAGLESQRAFQISDRPRKFTGADDLDAVSAALAPERFTLLLAHEPDIFPDLPEHYDLTLSGHLHGGQIAPFGRPILVPSRYGTHYAYGHYEMGQKQMIVSGGIGYSGIPLRLGAPPEIVLVEIG